MPTVRRFDLDAFSLTLDARIGGGELVDIIDGSSRANALFTFDELATLLGR